MTETTIETTEQLPVVKKTRAKRTAQVGSLQFLDASSREDIIKQLKESGYEIEGLSDADLLKKLTASNRELNSKVVSRESNGLENKLNEYAYGSILTNKELIGNLVKWGIPKLYVKIFSNNDVTLTKEQIWEKVRESGIQPITSIAEIMKYRHPEKQHTQTIR